MKLDHRVVITKGKGGKLKYIVVITGPKVKFKKTIRSK